MHSASGQIKDILSSKSLTLISDFVLFCGCHSDIVGMYSSYFYSHSAGVLDAESEIHAQVLLPAHA